MTSALKAEAIRGRVIDAETRETLQGVVLTCTGAYKNQDKYISFTHSLVTDSLGNFLFYSSGPGRISAKMIGYHTKEVGYIAFMDGDRDTVDVGDIALKFSDMMLKALNVEERMRRFTIKGDTVVFHPEAFHLEKGARLEELIAQLPGVEVNGDKLTWNGKPIRVVMNGEQFLGNSQFYRQLPAEAIETIKAYNKTSEFSERTGKDDGKEDMVLDLKIKKSFLDKFYGRVGAAYQTPKYYDAEVTVHRLSENNPMLATTSINSLAKERRQSMGGTSESSRKDFGEEQYGAAGYQHNWWKMENGQMLKSNWSIIGGMAHDDRRSPTRTDTENFFLGQSQAEKQSLSESYNYTTTSNSQHQHGLNPYAEVKFRQAINPQNTISSSASFNYRKSRDINDYRSAQFNHDPYSFWAHPLTEVFDSLTLPGMLMRNRTQSISEGHNTALNAAVSWTHYIKDGSLNASASVNYDESLREELTERVIDYFIEEEKTTRQYQTLQSPGQYLSTMLKLGLQKWVHKNILLDVYYGFRDTRNHTKLDFFENGMPNLANSYDDRNVEERHTVIVGSTINLSSLQLMPKVSMEVVNERKDYRRDRLDTVATRNVFFWQPQLKAKWKITKLSALELNYERSTQLPNLIETIHYFDDSNPLYVREGNPNLNNTYTNSLSLKYNNVNSKRQQVMNFGLNFQNSDHIMQYVQTYNSQTLVYTSRPEMVRGNRQGGVNFNYDQGLGHSFRLKNILNIQYGQYYGYLTRTDVDEPWVLNRGNIFSPSENLTFSYDRQWLKCSVIADVSMKRWRYTQSPQQNTTLWNENIGIDITLNWEYITITMGLTEYIRQGYLIDNMNKNYLIWNASATWKFLENKARLKLDVNDILNQYDTFYAQQTAYQNIYRWREYRHHYINISFTYNFDARRKK